MGRGGHLPGDGSEFQLRERAGATCEVTWLVVVVTLGLVMPGMGLAGTRPNSPLVRGVNPGSRTDLLANSRGLNRVSTPSARPKSHPLAALSGAAATASPGGPYVASTLVPLNNTRIPGAFAASNGYYPEGVAYDSAKRDFYVTDSGSHAISVISAVTNQVVATLPAGNAPSGIAYDSAKGELFVANNAEPTVSVVSDQTNTIVDTIPVPTGAPWAAAYDPGKGEVFVTLLNWTTMSGNVSVISDANDTVVATIPVVGFPEGLAYDSNHGVVYVGSATIANMSIISDATNSVIGNFSAGAYTGAVAVDAARGEVLAINAGAVGVINDTTNAVVASITLPFASGPYGVALDATRADIFVTLAASSAVEVLSLASGTEVDYIPISVGATPHGIAYDPADDKMLAADYDFTSFESHTVTMISAATHAVIATLRIASYPSYLAYDSGKGEIFVSDPGSDTVLVVSEDTDQVIASVPVGYMPLGVAYDSGKGEIFVVNNIGGSASVISDKTNSVVATIPGIYAPVSVGYDPVRGDILVGGNWNATVTVISDVTNSIVAYIGVGPYPLAITYDSGKQEMFVASFTNNNVTVLSAATLRPVTRITVCPEPTGLGYDARDGMVFAACQNSSAVAAISDTTNTLLTETAVPGAERLAFDDRTGQLYVAGYGTSYGAAAVYVLPPSLTSWSAVLPVGGEPQDAVYDPATNSVYFTEPVQGSVPIVSDAVYHNVTFAETGLPPGTRWSVAVNGSVRNSTSATIAFRESNGAYPFSVGPVPDYAASPASGQVVVAGSDTVQPVNFTRLLYAVTLTETGLPPGTAWWVNLTSGPSASSDTGIIRLLVPNGTYPYQVASADKRYAAPTGSLTVAGSPQTVTVSFQPVTFALTFTESGLAVGTSWSLTVNGLLLNSSGTSIVYLAVNGTYRFVVVTPNGYLADPDNGTVQVQGAARNVAIMFTTTSAIGAGLLVSTVTLILVVAVMVVLILLQRRRRRGSPPESE